MITVFGSINLDLVVSVPRLPGPGETVSGPDHQSFAGGKGANQALAARRAGADVHMVGAVGTDAFAELALSNLKSAGVDLSTVRNLDGATGLALIGVEASGENQIIVASGANARVEAAWLDQVIAPKSLLVLQGEVPANVALDAMKAAQLAGAKVFYNPAPVPRMMIEELVSATDILVVNETEAEEVGRVFGVSGDPDDFCAKLATDDRLVVVTLGAQGIVAWQKDRVIRLRPPTVDVVDTTGAGDAFCGALAAALDNGRELETALKYGVAAGSLACTVTGAQTSAPTAEQIAVMSEKVENIGAFTT
ncbi:ribokinase [Roseibium sp. TrichSKD4]|uniref:ribokinase n=1 Tax=Roseibium sp. TrichSKD4 TaxID=744980 RepID=UPI00031B41FE|nr:ribokinase [Roseibium sp. TrichSKD4]